MLEKYSLTNMAQISITFFVVQMGTSSLAAFTYAQNIARLSFAFALAIGQGSQIQTGYYIGKGWIDEIANRVQRYFVVGFIASITITCVVYIFPIRDFGFIHSRPRDHRTDCRTHRRLDTFRSWFACLT